jgi:hypothetical protein
MSTQGDREERRRRKKKGNRRPKNVANLRGAYLAKMKARLHVDVDGPSQNSYLPLSEKNTHPLHTYSIIKGNTLQD